MQSGLNPFVVNILPLANIQSNTSGLDNTTLLSNAISNLQTLVSPSNKTVYTNYVASYTAPTITILSPLTLCNVEILYNGINLFDSLFNVPSTLGTVSSFITATSNIVMVGSTFIGGPVLTNLLLGSTITANTLQTSTLTASTINTGTCSAKQFITLSDERAKTNISSFSVGALRDIKTYSFNYHDSSTKEIGLLAQELEAYPECVVDGPEGKYIKYDAVVALLVGAVRDLERRVSRLDGGQSHPRTE